MNSVIVGNGIAFPIVLQNGAPVLAKTDELIKSSIKMILGWPINDKFFMPEFGSRMSALLEEPNDAILRSLIRYSMVEALGIWEPRIKVQSFAMQSRSPEQLDVFMSYIINESNKTDSLIYPFYKTRLI